MDRYKFRGKRLDSGEWVYGYYYQVELGERFAPYINTFDGTPAKSNCYRIDPATIGQSIGIKDKNDQPICEGDVVNMHQFLFDGCEFEKEITGVVVYDPEMVCFSLTKIDCDVIAEYIGIDTSNERIPICDFYGLHEESWEIIGNIHDNPEMLKTA